MYQGKKISSSSSEFRFSNWFYRNHEKCTRRRLLHNFANNETIQYFLPFYQIERERERESFYNSVLSKKVANARHGQFLCLCKFA